MTKKEQNTESFAALGISENILHILSEMQIESPTEIQGKAIPLAHEGKDIIAGSATGSGKTLAFGINILEKIKPKAGVQALIITPTRELAEQVGRVFQRFTKSTKVKTAIIYGSVGMSPQISDIRHSEIIVGTPGRLLDHLNRNTLKLDKIKTLVLDEADRMLDMGFIEDVDSIISQCAKDRQTLLFSATISADINHIAKKYLNKPVEISAKSQVDPSKLSQSYYDVQQHMKFSLLTHLLKKEKAGLVMVFCNTRHNTDFVAQNLKNQGLHATAIHGGLTQNRRNAVLDHFHKGHALILVCTDVAARGLDIKNVSHVYNYDIPANDKEYIHRIGRTARAGKEGKAISIVSPRDYNNFRTVLINSDINVSEEEMPEVEQVSITKSNSRGYGDRGRSSGRSGYGNRGSSGGDRGRSSYGRRESGSRDSGRRPYSRSGSSSRSSSGSSGRSDSRSGGRSYGGRGRDGGSRTGGRSSYGSGNQRSERSYKTQRSNRR